MTDEWPIAGTLLATRYRLVALLETGGMAEIWRADDQLLGRPVAIKLPTGPQVAWREARMAAKLSHPGIAAVGKFRGHPGLAPGDLRAKSEEHTSELQSRRDLVCRLLLEKKKKTKK